MTTKKCCASYNEKETIMHWTGSPRFKSEHRYYSKIIWEKGCFLKWIKQGYGEKHLHTMHGWSKSKMKQTKRKLPLKKFKIRNQQVKKRKTYAENVNQIEIEVTRRETQMPILHYLNENKILVDKEQGPSINITTATKIEIIIHV